MAHRWSVVLALALAGCFSSKTEPANPVQPVAAAPAPAPKHDHLQRVIADPLGFLPADSEVVVHFDVQRLRRSAIWQQYEPAMLQSAGFQRFKTECGLDPLAQLATLRFGFKNVGDKAQMQGVMVVTGLDNAQLRKCIAASKPSGNITVDGDVILGVSDGSPYAFELVGSAAIVGVYGPRTDRAALAAVLDTGVPLRSSPAFTDIFSAINTQTALWFVMNGSSKVFDQAAALGFRPTAIFGSVGVVDGLSASARLRFESPGAATQLSTTLSGQVGTLKSFVDRVDVSADANDVVVELGMTDAQINAIIGMLGMFASPSPPPAPPAPGAP